MSEAVDKQTDQPGMMPMSPEMLMGIRRVFAQKIAFEINEEVATLTFGSTANIIPENSKEPREVMLPQVICHLSIPHLFRLRDMLTRQCDLFQKAMDEQKEAGGAG